MSETWTQRLIKAALRIQDRLSSDVPDDMKIAGKGRNGKLVIEGDDGCEIYLKWNGNELVEEENPESVRNVFFLHAQTLLDLISGEIGVREAAAARLIRVTGDRSLYDSEDIVQLLEKLRDKIVLALQEKRSKKQ